MKSAKSIVHLSCDTLVLSNVLIEAIHLERAQGHVCHLHLLREFSNYLSFQMIACDYIDVITLIKRYEFVNIEM